MNDQRSGLGMFHPHIAAWFAERIGRPTPTQRRAWTQIAAGDHLLVTAPTGSGKTLAAFLWALNQLVRETWASGATQVLYISPLKALNNDIRRNLTTPLEELRQTFVDEGLHFPPIRVNTRSGDTPPYERRQMIRRPPEILITTPESLHLMLSSQGGRSILGDLRTVILDEVHAVVGSKRGTLLMSAVERLVPLSGEFQRIALSATVNPEAAVADFVGGFRLAGDVGTPAYIRRPVKRCRSMQLPRNTIFVRIPDAVVSGTDQRSVWEKLSETLGAAIAGSRSTIIFTNSRRLCEKLTFLINAGRAHPLAYAHHGSLSRELRLEVEQRLKNGDLKAIVATASLELGIDVGSLDHVIMVQSPPSIASAVQRIGRSGHSVGATGRATFFATHASDLLTAAVLAEAVKTMAIEPVRPVECPLDVLAQVLVSMTGVESWHCDALYHAVRTAYPYRRLERPTFDLVVEMLAGRYAKTRIAALQPKIAFDRIDGTLTARKGALMALYLSGGVIPDRGYFGLHHHETGARIGELDEEFVWEAKRGQIFTLGTQSWRIRRITHNDVFVSPARPKAPAPPFWRAEQMNRRFPFSERIGGFLETAQKRLADPAFEDELRSDYCLDGRGAGFLIDFLKRQQAKTGCPLPHRHHVVVERTPSGKTAEAVDQLVIHTFWGGRVNRPYALALEAAFEKHCGHLPSVFPTDDAVHLLLPAAVDDIDVLDLVSPEDVEALIRGRLEGSGIFGARFRECAARALLLPRRHFRQRMPLWLTRQQSQKLLDSVGRFTDFPILLETWRSCLQDDFDMPALRSLLQELQSSVISRSHVRTAAPSPMALTGSWRLINQFIYADDRQTGRVQTDLSRDLLRQVLLEPQSRPAVDAGIVDDFQEKRQRLYPGYAPDAPADLLEWVKERLLVPLPEWERLIERARTDGKTSLRELLFPIEPKLRLLQAATGREPGDRLVVAAEALPDIVGTLYAGRQDLRGFDLQGRPMPIGSTRPTRAMDRDQRAREAVAQWLRYYGPLTAASIRRRLCLDASTLEGILADLVETGVLVAGNLVQEAAGKQVCDADNYDTLVRMSRRRQRPVLEPRDIGELALYLAHFQGLTAQAANRGDLAACLERLMCLPLPAALWETDVLPARIGNYDPHRLDRLMQESTLMWIGRPGRQVAFCHADDLDLMVAVNGDVDAAEAEEVAPGGDVSRLFPDKRAAYTLSALMGDPPRPAWKVEAALWEGVWAGKVANDTMAALRQAVARRFKAGVDAEERPSAGSAARAASWRNRRRSGFARQRRGVGHWHLVHPPPPPEGLMEAADLLKERARLLLDRYGILFRQMLSRELSGFQWPSVFRALRLMELAGEVVGGCFFKEIPGLQFASQPMVRMLGKALPEDCLYWLSAKDPSSLCGLGIDALNNELPPRMSGTHLVYLGSRLVMTSARLGKRLEIHLPVDHVRLADCFALFDHLLGRWVAPLRAIGIKTINGVDAAESPYAEVLSKRFDIVVETPGMTIFRRPTT